MVERYRGTVRAGWVLALVCLPLVGGSAGVPWDRLPEAAAEGMMLQVGEELEYRVSYLFFNLGTIRIQVLDRFERDGRVVYRAKAFMDSNPSLSWLISLHAVFISEFDEEIFSYNFIADEEQSDGIFERKFAFDYEQGRVLIQRGTRRRDEPLVPEHVDTVKVTEKCQDGLSLFFYAREHVLQKKEDTVATFVEKEQVTTYISFSNDRTPTEIDSVAYPLRSVAFSGRADFVGVAGLTGGFRGWFSSDSGRVPLLARMNVLLGSVKVELIRWKRADWIPPRMEAR
jgi:hypothetical protein